MYNSYILDKATEQMLYETTWRPYPLPSELLIKCSTCEDQGDDIYYRLTFDEVYDEEEDHYRDDWFFNGALPTERTSPHGMTITNMLASTTFDINHFEHDIDNRNADVSDAEIDAWFEEAIGTTALANWPTYALGYVNWRSPIRRESLYLINSNTLNRVGIERVVSPHLAHNVTDTVRPLTEEELNLNKHSSVNNTYLMCFLCRQSRTGVDDVQMYLGVSDFPERTVCSVCITTYLYFCRTSPSHGATFRRVTWGWSTAEPEGDTHPTREPTHTEFVIEPGQAIRFVPMNAGAHRNRRAPRYCPECAITEVTQEEEEPTDLNHCVRCQFWYPEIAMMSSVDPTAPGWATLEGVMETRYPHTVNSQDWTTRLCIDCAMAMVEICSDCGADFEPHNLRRSRGPVYCRACIGNTEIMNYSYKPTAIFHGEHPKGLFMGIEIELCLKRGHDPNSWARNHGRDFKSDLFYFKRDSSLVNGVEIVTHPMAPHWAIKNFPFDLFDHWIDEGVFFRKHSSAGQHIHLSKNAFSQAHMWKLLMLHWQAQELIRQIGGRTYDFHPPGVNHIAVQTLEAQERVQIENQPNDEVVRRLAAKALAKAKRGNASRSVAVNLNNSDTIELRYPEGDCSGRNIRKNIEWMEALYTFTDIVTVKDVKAGALQDPGYLVEFIEMNSDRWPTLSQHLSTIYPQPKTLPSTIGE